MGRLIIPALQLVPGDDPLTLSNLTITFGFGHLDGLWVVEMVTQLHQNLRHPVWDIVGAGEDAGAEAQHAGVAPHQVCMHTQE